MVTVLEKLQELANFYLAWVESADKEADADEAAYELMKLEGFFIEELERPRTILRFSTFAEGSRIAAELGPDKKLLEARLKILTKTLITVKAIYKERNWKF